MSKIVKESLNEELQEGLRLHGVTYNAVKTSDGTVHVGHEGILGDNHTLISWDTIKNLMSKYAES